MIPGRLTTKAAEYLLSILADEPFIRYSKFYDGEESTETALRQGMGISDDDADLYSAEALMDDAVWQLAELGFVESEILPDLLSDGEPDYAIRLTTSGTEFLASGAALVPFSNYYR
jgi:hypothetical protein